MPNLSADHRLALELLAGSSNGLTQAFAMVSGITANVLVDLIIDGLAAAEMERMVAGWEDDRGAAIQDHPCRAGRA